MPLSWHFAETVWTLSGYPPADKYCQGADWVYCPKNDFIPLRQTKLAVTIHGAHELDPALPQSRDLKSVLNRVRRRLSYRRIVQRADLLLTVSSFLKKQIVEWFHADESKIVVVGNGVENVFFDVAKDSSNVLKMNAHPPYLLCVGGLNAIDGGYEIIAAAKLMKSILPDFQILVAGWQHAPELLKQAKELSNIQLLGYVETPRLAVLMRDAFALLFLTRYETFGIAAAEAMATGTPVITLGGTAVPEILGDVGLYVSDYPHDVVDKLRRLREEEGLRERLQKAGQQRAQQFTWQACVDRLVDAFEARA
jgi:glycosyltransferase involved in cell wall biosynthesis